LVCEYIHTEVEHGVAEAMQRRAVGKEVLAEVVREYFLVCHRMSDFILLIYQETRSLPVVWRKRVLENELRITGVLMEVLAGLVAGGDLPAMSDEKLELVAHNITVLGHMWTFRRWYLARHHSIDDYIRAQTDLIIGMVSRSS